MNDQNPFNALPPVVVALAVVIGGIELLFQAADAGLIGGPRGVGWRLAALEDYAVLDQVWRAMVAAGFFPLDELARFVAYPLIHTSFVHAAFVVVFVLALGKAVGEVFSAPAVLAVFWGASVVGGLAFVLALDSRFPLAGGYPGAYGLIGAFTFLLWTDLGQRGLNQNRAFTLIGLLLGIQLLFGIIFGSNGEWVADIAGFATGFALSFIVVPGGWARVLERLRRR